MDKTRLHPGPTVWLAVGVLTGLLIRHIGIRLSAPGRHQVPVPGYAPCATDSATQTEDAGGWSGQCSQAVGHGRDQLEGPDGADRARAAEPGRGRQASAPWQIPWQGWKDVVWRTYREIGDDRLVAIAAGVVFFALLALFPAVTALVSIYALVADPATINDHLSIVASVVPAGGMSIIQEQIARILAKGEIKLGMTFAVGLAIALWSANAGMKAMIEALNVVYDEEERRGFIRLNLSSLAFTFGAVVALLLAIGAVVVFPLLLSSLGLGRLAEILMLLLRWPALALVVLLGLALIYRHGPSRREARWQWLTVGSACATLAWLAGSALLSWYLSNWADYDATYGSLGAAIGLMMWMWLSTIAFLLGAELNSEIEHQTARDSTVGPEKPLGARGAEVADSVGEAQT